MTPTINDLYIKEGSYTKAQIMKKLGLNGPAGDKIFQQLRTKGIIKLVKQEASEIKSPKTKTVSSSDTTEFQFSIIV